MCSTTTSKPCRALTGLYKKARPQAIYERSLELLQRVREGWPRCYSKSGLMVGLGNR